MNKVVTLFLLVLLVPLVQGQTLQDNLFGEGNEGETVRYQIRDITNTSIGGWTDEFEFLKLHTFEIGPGGSIIRVNVQATYAFLLENDGVWEFNLLVDGVDVDDCGFQVPTVAPGGFLQGDLPVYPSYDVECTISPLQTSAWVEGESIQVEWERVQLSGSPDEPAASIVSVVFEREDFVLTTSPTAFEALTGASGLEFLVFLVVIALAILLWSRSTDPVVEVFSAALLFLFGAIAILLYSEWIGWLAFGAILCALGGYLIVRSSIEWFNEA